MPIFNKNILITFFLSVSTAHGQTRNMPAKTTTNGLRNTQETNYLYTGCFFAEDSPSQLRLRGQDGEEECASFCSTRFFGIAAGTCRCYAVAPEERLSFGDCALVDGVSSPNRMELYFDVNFNTDCSQANTETVRNFLIEDDDAPFGFDIVTGDFKTSPFNLFPEECGTNVYEVQTEVTGTSGSLRTQSSQVSEYSRESRSQHSRSISTSASVSYESALGSASTTVSGAMDAEQTNLFQSSGASNNNSEVLTSFGVQTIAEVQIVDFENKQHFVTLTPQFTALIRRYLEGGFQFSDAEDIINTYGHVLVERGLFGGFVQFRSTLSAQDISRTSLSEQQRRACYEVSVSAKAEEFGFSGSASAEQSGCNQESLSVFQSSRNAYSQEVSEQTVVGGRVVGDEFEVLPSDATLLTNDDHYPAGDAGVQFRLISDFLAADKISPLQLKTSLLTEQQYQEIHDNLQIHILQALEVVEDSLEMCHCSGDSIAYLQENGQCACYSPTTYTDPSCEVVDSCNPGVFQDQRLTCKGNHDIRTGNRCPTRWVPCQVGANPGVFEGEHWVCIQDRELETGNRCGGEWLKFNAWKQQCGI